MTPHEEALKWRNVANYLHGQIDLARLDGGQTIVVGCGTASFIAAALTAYAALLEQEEK